MYDLLILDHKFKDFLSFFRQISSHKLDDDNTNHVEIKLIFLGRDMRFNG